MPEQIETVGMAIEKLGGDPAVASIFEVSTKAVSNWRVTNRFPANTYLEISARLSRNGFSCPDSLFAFRRAPGEAGSTKSTAECSGVP